MLLCWSVLFMTLHLLELVPTKGKLVEGGVGGEVGKIACGFALGLASDIPIRALFML